MVISTQLFHLDRLYLAFLLLILPLADSLMDYTWFFLPKNNTTFFFCFLYVQEVIPLIHIVGLLKAIRSVPFV